MMDSGNSGSLQSSSGGDEEYDSRSESISSFLNSSPHFGSISGHQPQQPPSLLSHQQPTLFGHPHSQNADVFPQSLPNPTGNSNNSSNIQYSSDMLWSRGLRSDPNSYSGFGNVTAVSSSSTQSVLNVQALSHHHHQSAVDGVNAAVKTSAGQQSDQHNPNPVKNPKKRTRASRRAPTTVLTTDTSNFRQMVQEFTGIPTAPFSAGSPYSRRLDLFSTGTSNSLGGPLYPLRPSAQKVHQLTPSSLLNSSAMIDSGNNNTPQNLLSMQNQMLSFQSNNTSNNNNIPSFLQHPSLKNHPSSSNFTGKSQNPSFDELGLNSGLFPNSSAALSDHHHQHQQQQSQNLQGSSFLHHHEKGLENVTSGGEGTVGSWICPSD